MLISPSWHTPFRPGPSAKAESLQLPSLVGAARDGGGESVALLGGSTSDFMFEILEEETLVERVELHLEQTVEGTTGGAVERMVSNSPCSCKHSTPSKINVKFELSSYFPTAFQTVSFVILWMVLEYLMGMYSNRCYPWSTKCIPSIMSCLTPKTLCTVGLLCL